MNYIHSVSFEKLTTPGIVLGGAAALAGKVAGISMLTHIGAALCVISLLGKLYARYYCAASGSQSSRFSASISLPPPPAPPTAAFPAPPQSDSSVPTATSSNPVPLPTAVVPPPATEPPQPVSSPASEVAASSTHDAKSLLPSSTAAASDSYGLATAAPASSAISTKPTPPSTALLEAAPPVSSPTITPQAQTITRQKSMDWTPRNLSPEIAHEKMVKNAKKACDEMRANTDRFPTRDEKLVQRKLNHESNRGFFTNQKRVDELKAELQNKIAVSTTRAAKTKAAYATWQEAPPPSFEAVQKSANTCLFEFSSSMAGIQGKRSTMEDDHAHISLPNGELFLVADGHGTDSLVVSQGVCKEFNNEFAQKLKESPSLHAAFESMIFSIHEKNKNAWGKRGCTLVVSYLTRSGFVYTATVGDAEANIYRDINAAKKSIPLSCVRDWSSEKDSVRLFLDDYRGDPSGLQKAIESTKKEPIPKNIRGPRGLNLSRSIGDSLSHPVIATKPKITVQQLKEGDIITLMCDGPKDAVLNYEHEIVEWVAKNQTNQNMAHDFVNWANTQPAADDNMTAIFIRVNKATASAAQPTSAGH